MSSSNEKKGNALLFPVYHSLFMVFISLLGTIGFLRPVFAEHGYFGILYVIGIVTLYIVTINIFVKTIPDLIHGFLRVGDTRQRFAEKVRELRIPGFYRSYLFNLFDRYSFVEMERQKQQDGKAASKQKEEYKLNDPGLKWIALEIGEIIHTNCISMDAPDWKELAEKRSEQDVLILSKLGDYFRYPGQSDLFRDPEIEPLYKEWLEIPLSMLISLAGQMIYSYKNYDEAKEFATRGMRGKNNG